MILFIFHWFLRVGCVFFVLAIGFFLLAVALFLLVIGEFLKTIIGCGRVPVGCPPSPLPPSPQRGDDRQINKYDPMVPKCSNVIDF